MEGGGREIAARKTESAVPPASSHDHAPCTREAEADARPATRKRKGHSEWNPVNDPLLRTSCCMNGGFPKLLTRSKRARGSGQRKPWVEDSAHSSRVRIPMPIAIAVLRGSGVAQRPRGSRFASSVVEIRSATTYDLRGLPTGSSPLTCESKDQRWDSK
jgi:hypothetical protein